MLRFNTNLIKLFSMQSVQTTEQKQIPGEGGREMRQRRKEDKRDLKGHQPFCISLFTDLTNHSSSITAPTAPHSFLYHFQYLNFCSHSLPKPTSSILWEPSLQLNFPSIISKQKELIWSPYKLEIFLLMQQYDFVAFRLKLCLSQILSTEILSEN